MPHDTAIEIRLSGKSMVPGTIRSKEIAEVITAIEDMIASLVLQKNPDLGRDSVIVGLADIQQKSIGLIFKPNLPDLVLPATLQIGNSIATGDFSRLPSKALAALEVLTGFARKHDCEAELATHNGKRQQLAIITPATKIPARELLNGETVVYGEITRVGGADPKIQFKTLDGQLIYCTATKLMVKKAGEQLYTKVGMRGAAKWDPETNAIDELHVTAILDYVETPLTDAFEQLSVLIGKSFSTVDDVSSFAKELRYGLSEA
jgi:hypothetical protein